MICFSHPPVLGMGTAVRTAVPYVLERQAAMALCPKAVKKVGVRALFLYCVGDKSEYAFLFWVFFAMPQLLGCLCCLHTRLLPFIFLLV